MSEYIKSLPKPWESPTDVIDADEEDDVNTSGGVDDGLQTDKLPAGDSDVPDVPTISVYPMINFDLFEELKPQRSVNTKSGHHIKTAPQIT